MTAYLPDDLSVFPDKTGATAYTKVSYPIRYGRYSEIRTPSHLFQFNLNGEIKFIQGRAAEWPDPSEWLKRTVSGDWVYYATGGYTGVYDAIGEYYVPCFPYPSNRISTRNPFREPGVSEAPGAWESLRQKIESIPLCSSPGSLQSLLQRITGNTASCLKAKADRIAEAIGGRPTVLPPDARHVDYDLIPVTIADGCLYDCTFCSIKSGVAFTKRSRDDIRCQIDKLRALFSDDLVNYNSLFLGQHDALMAGADLIAFAAEAAFSCFEIERSLMRGANLFLFGSVDSFLNCGEAELGLLNRLPYHVYINIGLESADDRTLDIIGKRIDAKKVDKAFRKMLEVNRLYANIDITVNFLFDDNLPRSHLDACFSMMNGCLQRPTTQGAVYFSPLFGPFGSGKEESQRQLLSKFFKLRNRCRLPAYMYLIQRL